MKSIVTDPEIPSILHVPVLCEETINALNIVDGGCYIDGTFGGGGFTDAILSKAFCRVFAIDRDPMAISRGAPLIEKYGDRLTLIEGRFGCMEELIEIRGPKTVDAVALDLGVSSPQIDNPDRGFSFRADGPLDMRMGADGPTAADLVNTIDEFSLANLIYELGEERFSRRVAKAIVMARRERPIRTTNELAEIVRKVVPRAKSSKTLDSATRTFQALRIYINDELGELDRGLIAAERLLAPGGRLAVIAFHSLEDRKIKSFMRERAGRISGLSRHDPPAIQSNFQPSFSSITKKPIRPGKLEIKANPRAQSAKLRVAERTSAPAWTNGTNL